MKLTLRRLNSSDGFALPTILLVSVVLLSILMASIGAASSSRVALDAQYYNKLASQAAESGVARAKDCLYASGYAPQWSTKALDRDLRPNTDCRGLTVLSDPYVLGEVSSAVRSYYSIEAPDGAGVGSSLKVVGVAELVRSSPPYDVWRRFEQVVSHRIEPPDTAACPVGFIPVPGNPDLGTGGGFCVAKYEAKRDGSVAVSRPGGQPITNVSHNQARSISRAACDGCHLITEAEWLTIAHDVAGVASNWSGGSVGSGFIYSGHNDNDPAGPLEASDDSSGYHGTKGVVSVHNSQRRTLTLSNGQVIWDFAGNVAEWTSGYMSTGKPGLPGLGWRDWSAVSDTGSISPSPWPSLVTPEASSWTAASHRIGGLRSDSGNTDLSGFVRGGHWNSDSYAGVFALSLGYKATDDYGEVGFRVAAEPTFIASTTPSTPETIFVFDTTRPGCNANTVQLPVTVPSRGGTVDWGDGNEEPRIGSLMTHTYDSSGVYTVTYKGEINEVSYENSGSQAVSCLTRVNEWGSGLGVTKVNFKGARNLVYVAEPPHTVTDMSSMFDGASSFNQDISGWDVSTVRDMAGMLAGASFNQPIGGWDVSNVENMRCLFCGATAFNQPIGSWNVSRVTNMHRLFSQASNFNQPIGSWDVSNVTDMESMFYKASDFNRPIGAWDVSNVSEMGWMFQGASSFNQSLSGWGNKLSNVWRMNGMFQDTTNFNGDIRNWDVSGVTNMRYMFLRASSFNQDISGWDVSNVTDMNRMFASASSFNQDISGWDVDEVEDWHAFSGTLTALQKPPKFRP